MSDLIDRQAAVNAVCMEWCNLKHQDCKHALHNEENDYYWCDGCETVLRTLPDLPAAQPEIIRCKDCRYYDAHECKHPRALIFSEDDDFCSHAERRIDG